MICRICGANHPRSSHNSSIAGRLVLILVFSITLLRRNALLAKAEEVWRQYSSTSLKTPSECILLASATWRVQWQIETRREPA